MSKQQMSPRTLQPSNLGTVVPPEPRFTIEGKYQSQKDTSVTSGITKTYNTNHQKALEKRYSEECDLRSDISNEDSSRAFLGPQPDSRVNNDTPV